MPFTFTQTIIPDVICIEAKSFPDSRGFFTECFKQSDFFKSGIEIQFVQDNFSHSIQGSLRGLHYQLNPKSQAKLVTALQGEIFDVAIDIRKNSPTYGKWVSEILSGKNHKLLFIPEGFAHGFCVLSETADVLYKVSNEYSPEHDRGIVWNDSEIGINWPIQDLVVSDKDSQLPLLSKAENNF